MNNLQKPDMSELELLEILAERSGSKLRTFVMGNINGLYAMKKKHSGSSPLYFLGPANIITIAEIIDAPYDKLVQEMDNNYNRALEYSFKPQDLMRLKNKLTPLRRTAKLVNLGI